MIAAPPSAPRTVLVVGAGLVGAVTAWRLHRAGHRVVLIDPALAPGQATASTTGLRSGSTAALGVLMGQVFHRSSGRGWRLRQQSLALWEEWLTELAHRGHPVPHRRGLLLLSASPAERERHLRLAMVRQAQGLTLELWDRERLHSLEPAVPAGALSGLHSPADGQLDPAAALEAFRIDSAAGGVTAVAERASALERRGSGWRLALEGGGRFEAEWVVLATAEGCGTLPGPIAEAWPLEPVLGQALELELGADSSWSWPGAVLWRGINLVPRPDLARNGRRLWLGATVEPGRAASHQELAELRNLSGEAPAWLLDAAVVRQWRGLRYRPLGRPAPLLEEPEPGLLLATGHYRNGVLLAPATAAWVCNRINGAGRQV